MKDSLEVLFDVGKDNPEFMFYHNALEKNPDADLDELEKEYHRLYDKKSLKAIDTSSMVTDTLIQTLKDTPLQAFVGFEKENKQAKKVRDDIWEIDGKKFTTSGLLNFLNIDNKPQEIKESIKMENTKPLDPVEEKAKSKVKSQIERLQENEILSYDVADRFGFNKLNIMVNNLHPNYYILWNENDEGEIANLTKYSSLDNAIYWVIEDATSFQPTLYRNKHVRFEEEWNYGDSNINYIDTYIWKDDTLDEMEFNEFMDGLKDFFDENLSDYEYIRLEIAPYEEKEGYYAVVPVFEDIDLGDGEFPAYEILNSRFENDYNISDTSKDMVKTYIKDVLKDIKNVNEDLKKLKTWGFKKVKDTDDFSHRVFKESYSYLDKKGNEKVDLEYSDIHYETDYGPMDWETGTGKKYISTDIDYTYTVDKQDIEEFFVDFLSGKDSVYDSIEDYDEYYKYIDDNFDDLMDKYYDDVLKHFEKYAEEEAYENTDPEDLEYYPDYDD